MVIPGLVKRVFRKNVGSLGIVINRKNNVEITSKKAKMDQTQSNDQTIGVFFNINYTLESNRRPLPLRCRIDENTHFFCECFVIYDLFITSNRVIIISASFSQRNQLSK